MRLAQLDAQRVSGAHQAHSKGCATFNGFEIAIRYVQALVRLAGGCFALGTGAKTPQAL